MTALAFNPAAKSANITLATLGWDGVANTFAYANTLNSFQSAVSTIYNTTGKWYCEAILSVYGRIIFGLANSSVSLTDYLGDVSSTAFGLDTNGGVYGVGGTSGWTGAASVVTVIGLAFDVPNKKFWVRRNGGGWMNGDPVAGTGGGTWSFIGAAAPAITLLGGNAYPYSSACYLNGGAYAFSAAVPSGFAAVGTAGTASPGTGFDALLHMSDVTLSNGNKTATWANTIGNKNTLTAALISATKSYQEVTINTVGSTPTIGVASPFAPEPSGYPGDSSNSGVGFKIDGNILANGASTPTGVSLTTGDILCLAADPVVKKVWFRKNGGAWLGGTSPNPATGAGGVDLTAAFVVSPMGVVPAVSGATGGTVMTLNAAGPFSYTNPFPSASHPHSAIIGSLPNLVLVAALAGTLALHRNPRTTRRRMLGLIQ